MSEYVIKEYEKEKKIKAKQLPQLDGRNNVFELFHFWIEYLMQFLIFSTNWLNIILYIKETLAVKLESQNKGNIQLKQKYEELKAMSTAKDELIARLENEMREQLVFVDKTIKVLSISKLKINLS